MPTTSVGLGVGVFVGSVMPVPQVTDPSFSVIAKSTLFWSKSALPTLDWWCAGRWSALTPLPMQVKVTVSSTPLVVVFDWKPQPVTTPGLRVTVAQFAAGFWQSDGDDAVACKTAPS